MSKQNDTSSNWEAFGEQVIEIARNTLARERNGLTDGDWFIARADARRVLRLAETLRLVEREPMEMPAHTGANRR